MSASRVVGWSNVRLESGEEVIKGELQDVAFIFIQVRMSLPLVSIASINRSPLASKRRTLGSESEKPAPVIVPLLCHSKFWLMEKSSGLFPPKRLTKLGRPRPSMSANSA